jgi:hypothetical protein
LTPRAAATLSLWASRFPSREPEHFVFPSERYGEGGAAYDSNPTTPVGRLEGAWEAAVVAQLAGSSASTAARTAKRYGHISERVLRDAIAVFDRNEIPEVSPEYHPEPARAGEGLPC